MPVNSEHKLYKKYKDQWKRCRDVIAGSDKVKAEQTRYLPKLGGQDQPDYDAYIQRALFYSATSRTVQALMGAIFRKNYTIEYPEIFANHLETTTLDGKPFDAFLRDVVINVLSTGRVSILNDVLGDAVNSRQYLAIYKAESGINWKEALVGTQKILTMYVLSEDYETKTDDAFQSSEKLQYRVLKLGTDDNKSIRYIQEVYRKGEGEEEYKIDVNETKLPTRIGVPLDKIPVVIINTYDLEPNPDKPPLIDLADVNLSHYVTSADLEHGAHFTALPTAWVAGFDTDEELKIGSQTAWVSEETDAKAGFLEYTGQGLGALEKRMDKKEQMMAILGARLLEETKSAAEAADTLKIRAASESGSLTAISENISAGIEKALKTMAWWAGATDQQIEEIVFSLNTDFIDEKLSSEELTALMKLYQANGISQDTFLYNLKRGELLPEGRTIEEEKELIEVQGTDDDLTNIIPIKRNFNVETDDNGRPTRFSEE